MITEAKPKRLYIYTKDVIRITGKGRGAALKLIRKIKLELKKPEDSHLTVLEFCQKQGLKIEDVNMYL
jgi:hypothetical protein